MSDRLFPITTIENLTGTDANLSLTPSEEYSVINYKTDEGNWRGIVEGTKFRPLHLSELSKKLESRGWNTGYKFFTHEDELWISQKFHPDYVPSLSSLRSGIPKQISWSSSLSSVYDEIKSDTNYAKILEEMNEKEINLYNTSTRGIDLVNGKQTIDVISINGDTYTNMLSLIPLKNHIISEGVSAKVDLMIAYTSSGNIFYHSTTFPAFTYLSNDGNLILEEEKWIEEVNGKLQIEYIDGIIRVMPLIAEVTECIISNCTIEYGRDN